MTERVTRAQAAEDVVDLAEIGRRTGIPLNYLRNESGRWAWFPAPAADRKMNAGRWYLWHEVAAAVIAKGAEPGASKEQQAAAARAAAWQG